MHADAAAELYAALAGQDLGSEQLAALSKMLAVDTDGRWVTRRHRVVDRALLAARALAGLFLFDEDVMWYSHLGSASVETFRRLRELVEGHTRAQGQLRRVSALNGAQRIETLDGRRLLFVSRHGGRGISVDCLLVDGQPTRPDEVIAALLPCVVGRANPQIVWCDR